MRLLVVVAHRVGSDRTSRPSWLLGGLIPTRRARAEEKSPNKAFVCGWILWLVRGFCFISFLIMEMESKPTPTGKTRRTHTKSRGGCAECKRRKLKVGISVNDNFSTRVY